MQFWLISLLASKLASGEISDRQGMHYFLASTLLVLVQTQYALWWGPRSGWLFYFEFFILALIACVGCVKCWSANNGREFVFRAICLSVPAGVRVFVISLLFGLILEFFISSMIEQVTLQNLQKLEWAYDIASYAGFVGFSIYFWWLVYWGIVKITRIQASVAPSA